MSQDVASPIDLRLMSDARDWAAKAERHPARLALRWGRDEILTRLVLTQRATSLGWPAGAPRRSGGKG